MIETWFASLATNSPAVIFGSALIEGIFSYPDRLHRIFPHPVTWAGNLIDILEQRFNLAKWGERTRRISGTLSLLVVVGLTGGIGMTLDIFLSHSTWGLVIAAFIGSFGLATRNLYDHVAAVAKPLSRDDLGSARSVVGRIVGRDTDAMDEQAVAAAATESLAESFNDGVIAPLFWFFVGGLCGLFVYKVVNTADSMIGHREERWRAFGWAAARTDDLMNLIPARLAGCLIVLAAGGRGWRILLRDASKHASPNSGWPEAAMAGALGCSLGGPVSYDGVTADRPVLGEGSKPDNKTLGRSLQLYIRACALGIACLSAASLSLALY